MFRGESEGSERTMKFAKSKILDVVKQNRDQHKRIFEEACLPAAVVRRIVATFLLLSPACPE